MPQTTITLSMEVKERLAQAKGARSWDEFLREVADQYVDEAIALAERRLAELRSRKARAVTLADVRDLRAARKKGGTRSQHERMDADHPPGRSRGARRPS